MPNDIYDEELFIPNLNGDECKYGDRVWTDSDGLFHRENGPAIIYKTGAEYWYCRGVLHREDGPACIWKSGNINEWDIDGEYITKDEWIQYLRDGKSSLDQKTINRIILENS